MSDAKFTPGPCHVVDNGHYLDISTAETDFNPCIGNVCPSKHLPGGNNEKANASLIATAPDMYLIIERLGKFCDDVTDEDTRLYCEAKSLSWEIDELLAKARGEQ